MRAKSILVIVLCLTLLGACTESSGNGPNNGAAEDATSDVANNDTTDNDAGGEDATDTRDAASNDDTSTEDTSTEDATGEDTSTDDTGTTDAADTNNGEDANDEDTVNNGGLYVGTGDPYATGSLGVNESSIASGSSGPPFDLAVWAPDTAGTYAVVFFVHGFQLENGYYSTMLSQLASHGFIVVAPQLSGGITGGPSAAEDATAVQQTLDWLETNLDGQVTGTPSFDHVGLSGHSRGSKVIWIVMSNDSSYGDALAGVDPVDGTGGPLGGEERVIDGQFAFNTPAFILGTGLGPQAQFGQACAPDGDNHVQFYGASQSPAWHVVATDFGHMDMLDANSGCGFVCSACPAGQGDLADMRTLTAGMLVAFFRGSLQGASASYSTLLDTNNAPATITAESK